ncbi:M4 family metallopeptidase [Embleya sp. NPDC001921]
MHRSTLTFGSVLALAVGLVVGTTAQSTTERARPVLAPDARAAAIAAADRAMADTGASTGTPGERYLRRSVLPWVGDIYSISYGRTYRGLPVVGADAAVLADGRGRVHAVQTAGDVRIDVATTPSVGRPTAEDTARTRLPVVDRVDTSRLVVRVGAGAAHLAWETIVVGRTDTAPSRLHVFVDAGTGTVLDSVDEVRAGIGHSQWNGPDPITIDTTRAGSTYTLRDPIRANLSCAKYGGAVFAKPVDEWGNGNPATIETGCVDALWAAQKQFDMFRNWLSRNGHNGNGGAWPLQVGLNDYNLYWDGSKVVIGRNTQNQWMSAMDLVGHEYGHAIDRMTQGFPFAEPGLAEGLADIMGTLTEAYANEPAPFDTPDYTIGEMANPFGGGPLRFMYNPSIRGDANCYTSAIPSMDPYRAAGVFNHWFYLLAEGSNPGGGKPASPTCVPTPVTGVGIKTAAKVVYYALMSRAGGTDYRQERRQTLYAAKALDPTCDVFRKTKAAWDAVTVPPAAGEPLCP